ncbi:hypothetical protein ABID22_000993 [Pontibacter aydingkolensis]|uniref:T9SS type A sorting domain-containing protein n=1 Tax=Pontibacter aydingkolensis TaxID=1911536 RepID=A0ABS7CSI7_9BACT|nr:T9SS type A sorting domain-containing protein [Pontibacter aydingkolensis]MBW7466755.1 T9SS type A sorting domain-containing protein [Pontibacter aydingkolensis]
MDITTLQNIIRFILSLLLALLPLHIIVAQEAPKTEKKLRIKYIENINGVETVKDTTIIVTGAAMSIPSFSGLKVDTAAFRKLHTGKFDTHVFETKPRQAKNKEFRVMRLSENLTEAEREVLIKQLAAHPDDSILNVLLQSGKLKVLARDSLSSMAIGRVAKAPKFKAYTIEGAAPKAMFRIQGDSIKALRFSRVDSLAVLSPAKAERIYIHKNAKHVTVDSLVFKSDGKTTYRIIANDSARVHRIFRIGEAGEERMLRGIALQPGKTVAIFIREVTVQDMTAEDISALKKTGTPVETKPKEELELEQIKYYPNPNDGRFNLRFKPENKGTTVVRVLDSKGQEVFVDTVEKLNGEYSRQIDLTPFGKGLYFLQVAQGKRYHTKKILVR